MILENIELLMKDLSCRIPYGVIVNVNGISNVKLTSVSWYGEVGVDDGSTYLYPISEIKPYLFPLSSMTKTQKNEYDDNLTYLDYTKGGWVLVKDDEYIIPYWFVDFCNKNHLDYSGLIEKGLAIDATGLNIY
jgi:hypothetical protein